MPAIKERFNAYHLVDRYQSGEIMKAIANDIGISQGSIGKLFKSIDFNWREAGRIKHAYDIHDLHAQHISGKSIIQLSKETGVSRISLNRWFDKEGLEYRNRSQGAYERMGKTTKEYRKKIASAANEARRGQIDSNAVKEKRAIGFVQHRVGLYEREIIEHLRSIGIDATGQHPLGIYNLDIFIESCSVSVEVYSYHPTIKRMADIHERTKYVLNSGISQLTVKVTYPSKIFFLSDVCDKIAYCCDFARRNESGIGHHGVIRGNAKIPSTSSHDPEGFSRIISF